MLRINSKSIDSKFIKHFSSISLFVHYLFSFTFIFFLCFAFLACHTEGKVDEKRGGKPHRIVSLAPNVTEILFSLGAGDRIVGVSSFCNYPPKALLKEKIGGFTNPNLEVIVSLSPDLIIGTPNVGNKEAILNLRKVMDADILLFKAENLEDSYKMIEGIGRAIGEEQRAGSLVLLLKREIKNLQKMAAPLERKRLLLSLSIDPIIAASAHSYPGILADIAGADLIPSLSVSQAQINDYPMINLEEVIHLDPDIIIQTMMDPINEIGEKRIKKFWEQWDSISAVQEQNIYVIPGDLILRPSPRAAEGVKLLFKLIHGASEIEKGKK